MTPTLDAVDAVDAIVREVRRRGFSSTELPRALLTESHDYPPGSPIQVELRARAGRFQRAHDRKEAARAAKEKAA
jgi:hypothetical protein